MVRFCIFITGQRPTFCIMSVTYLVLLPKMCSSWLYGRWRMGLWYSFLFSFKANHSQQQLDYKDVDIMQTEYHIIKHKKHMEFPQIYQSNVDKRGANLPGDLSRLVDSSSVSITERRPQRSHMMSWHSWSSTVEVGKGPCGLLQKETLILASFIKFTQLLNQSYLTSMSHYPKHQQSSHFRLSEANS